MTRELIMEELLARGYEVQLSESVKNGVVFKGITVGSGSIRPTIYTEQYEICDNMDSVVADIIRVYEQAMNNAPIFNLEDLTKWDNVKDKLQLCIQRKGNENIVKRSFLDLEQYVRVLVAGVGSFKISPEFLKVLGVDENILFQSAWACTKPTITAKNMNDFIVLSTGSEVHGAVAICDKEKLMEIATKFNTDLVILPSSIHECILMPLSVCMDFENLDAMVREVNETQVIVEEQLSDHAYRFCRSTKEITW